MFPTNESSVMSNMAVTRLLLANHEDVVALFGKDVGNYYFLVNDILDHNYHGESFYVYGEYENGQLVSILLNNFNNVTYYSREDRDITVYKDILSQLRFSKLSGPSSLMRKFLPFVEVQEDTLSYMGVVREVTGRKNHSDLTIKAISTKEELGMYYDLLKSAEEYSLLPDKEQYVAAEWERIEKKDGRTCYLCVDNVMVSACSTTKESRNSAIVIGVVTHPEHRNRGYASEVVNSLFQSLLNEGKYPYLFYSNPAARNVYKKLGMTEVCEWRVTFVKSSK